MELLYLVLGAFLVIELLSMAAMVFLGNHLLKLTQQMDKISKSMHRMEQIMESIDEDEDDWEEPVSPRDNPRALAVVSEEETEGLIDV